MVESMLCEEKLCDVHWVPSIPLRAVLLPGLQRAFRDGRTCYSGADVHENTVLHECSRWFSFLWVFLGMDSCAYSCAQKKI